MTIAVALLTGPSSGTTTTTFRLPPGAAMAIKTVSGVYGAELQCRSDLCQGRPQRLPNSQP
eukprot:6692767-Alexandrium_andersonii.AAC.1